MKFFNIDLHISVIADIENIFNDLGHSIDINYLSNHAWIFNKKPNNSFIINQSNWNNLDEKMCNDFYKKHKNELDKYDGFIVTHIPMLSLLYEKFKKPIIFIVSTRYEYPFTKDVRKWKWLNNYINNNEYIIPISNNLYDKWYCEQFTNQEFEYIPSICEYTKSKYNPKDNRHVLFSKSVNIKLPTVINKTIMGRYRWNDLFSFTSIIHFPYNVSTMSIFEQYSANMPLFFPSKKYLSQLGRQIYTELSYTQVLNCENKSVVDFKSNFDPNDINDKRLIETAIEFSDFYNFPHIIYFDSIEDLSIKLDLDFILISKKMEEFNLHKKSDVYNKWNCIIKKITY